VTTIRTVGHGTLAAELLADLLLRAGIEHLVDVRSFPGSRRNPQYGRASMGEWLPEAGISYQWVADLGGRRRPVQGSKHVALRHPSFRAYADHMEGREFLDAVERLIHDAELRPLAVMCSETVWWRCHRRLLADHLVLARDVEVQHLMHDGRLTPHRPTEGARRAGAQVLYDVGATPQLFDAD
jgi:uncharacterized protein (DUF488 family)